jgi:hypothetical protein
MATSISEHIHAVYRDGGVVLAGTAPELHPDSIAWVDGSKVERPCRKRGCGSILLGFTAAEAEQRLANHHRRFHA